MNNEAFLALVRAGLEFQDSSSKFQVPPSAIDYYEVLRLAEEQSVVGLVAAGVEKFTVYGLPFTEKIKLLGKCQLIEQRNEAMNRFIAELFDQLNKNGIDALLAKGQGVAQCYERPLWRSAGDIDLLLDDENYNKAKAFLSAFAEKAVVEDVGKKHLSAQIKGFTIELHGRMPFALSRRADRVVDEVVADTLLRVGEERTAVRVWKNGDTEGFVNLPLQIMGMRLSIFLNEDTEHPEVVRVSLRSVDDFPCNEMAAQFFNGGGHKNASGGRLQCTMEEALRVAQKAIQAYSALLK